tara:strand:- start:6865 stop:7413 length:549 start_codon:yes stop_codon:yes gene_type:complete
MSKQYTLAVEMDDDPQNPRTEFDNVTTMAFFHRKYSLGDSVDFDSQDFDDWEDMKKYILEEEDAYAVFPVYMYDHGGLTIRLRPFSCTWDSGQVGFVYVTKATVQHEFPGYKFDLEKLNERILKCVQGEVTTYDSYLSGQVFCYVVRDKDGDSIDSCYGYYSEKEAKEDGQAALEQYVCKEL